VVLLVKYLCLYWTRVVYLSTLNWLLSKLMVLKKLKGSIKFNPESIQPSHVLTFHPTIPGTYNVGVNFDGEPLLSPIPCTVLPTIDPRHCTVTGIPETKKGLDEPLTFTVIAKDKDGVPLTSGGLGHEKDLHVEIEGENQKEKFSPKAIDNDDGTFTISWEPEKPGPYNVKINYKGVPLSVSPLHFNVEDVAAAKYSMMAVTVVKVTRVACLVKAYNTKKDPKSTGGDDVKLYVLGPEGKVDHKLTDHNNGTYTVTYFADVPGNYEVFGTINGEPVIGSPKVYTL